MTRTVYVLGAGFSHAARLPLQAEILPAIQRLSVDLMTAPRHTLDEFSSARQVLDAFIRSVFGLTATPSLEDVFTLLDQTIASRGYCARYEWDELERIREALKRTILFVFHLASGHVPAKSAHFYRSVAALLLEERLELGQEGDPFAVVSLNWDSLLEDSIYWCLHKTKRCRLADIDYCCHTQALGPTCPHTPSHIQHATGMHEIKFLKLHGSVNWLACPNCARLYTGVGSPEGVWEQYAVPKKCPGCPKAGPQQTSSANGGSDGPVLQPFFITPTFVKLFDSPHIQMTWQSAHIELATAGRVVFIGYSLPQADYHFRTLLRRSLRADAAVVAVLAHTDDASRVTPRALRQRGFFAAERYREFFGADRVEIVLDGVERYFAPALRGRSLEARLRRIRGRLRWSDGS